MNTATRTTVHARKSIVNEALAILSSGEPTVFVVSERCKHLFDEARRLTSSKTHTISHSRQRVTMDGRTLTFVHSLEQTAGVPARILVEESL